MKYSNFSDIDVNDSFFDSLKADYQEFENWFKTKSVKNEMAFVLDDNGVEGFLYLKSETGEVNDIIPPLPSKKRIKVGTFKVNPHGTRLGERFLKKVFDYATIENAEEIYVTVFSKHSALINLFRKYGFVNYGTKQTANGIEEVLLKVIAPTCNDICMDYPLIKIPDTGKYLLSIYPAFHSRLFPDSLLNSENYDVIQDVSHTNSIHKIYICYMDVSALNPGDNIIIYRTSDGQGAAYYRSVATSVAVVEEMKTKTDFADLDDYLLYCKDYSVFNTEELSSYYKASKPNFFVIKMTYNAAFDKRLTRGKLLDEVGLDPNAYFGFLKLTDSQFKQILNLGGVSESIIID